MAYKMQRISVYQASTFPIEMQKVCVNFFKKQRQVFAPKPPKSHQASPSRPKETWDMGSNSGTHQLPWVLEFELLLSFVTSHLLFPSLKPYFSQT